MPIPTPTRRKRSGGCCGCGCLSTLFTLVIAVIVIGAISLGVYASSNPEGAATLIADPGKALNDIIAQIKSGLAQTPPQFTSYTAPPNTARTGAGVTLRWDTNGATVRLETLNITGTVTQSTTLASSGSYLISVRGSPGDTTIYRLVASLNGQTVTRQFTITVIR
ncbi:MAG: hypothetical protein ACYDBJ_16875 [Aggregatilineales bacterium]